MITPRHRGDLVMNNLPAASLLFSGAIGICVALRQFVLAVAVTLLTLIVLRGVEFIERRINNSTDER